MTKGFTLIELLVSLSIFSIVASFAAPSLHRFIQKQHLIADISTVLSLMNSAKNEAIKSNTNITICGKSSAAECSRNWQELKVQSPINHQLLYSAKLTGNYRSVMWSSFQRKTSLIFNARGYTDHLNGSLYFCHTRYPELNRVIRVSKSGRATIYSDKKSIGKRCD
ncbi:GspH/FimT family pseudopilin [Kangiella sp. HZ709]|uniref:GspH/FimT family pseudopilin n=1 Tax=Kangiella sp. HZ709 TaxID=2666328 RepID=UPI0012AF023E|nr:GspH/FimT family pseudopilin [Kangiella sp. HZ709]MRX28288.1 prepilin-type N-terminal cleavage/methylation domain-containing protein [Kangiella sp. HZ709]